MNLHPPSTVLVLAFFLLIGIESIHADGSSPCRLGGVQMNHRSMSYFTDENYVACANGKVNCFQESTLADQSAIEITCPTGKNIEQMIFDQENKRKLTIAVPNDDRLWPGGVVCYSVKSKKEFTSKQQQVFLKAMLHIESLTTIRFLYINDCIKQKMSKYCNSCKSYIRIKHAGKDSSTCESTIGILKKGENELNMADRCFEAKGDPLKKDFGTSIHEIGHSIGLYHEHQHSKRTIAVLWDEVSEKKWGQLKKKDSTFRQTEYDPDSIMHYPSHNGFCMPTFCAKGITKNTNSCVIAGTHFCELGEKEGDKGCVKIKKSQCDEAATKKFGQRRGLSKIDIKSILAMYPEPAAWSAQYSTLSDYTESGKRNLRQ